MSDFTCTRCGSHEAMQDKPIPGKIGDVLLQNTCPNCWNEWDEAQVMLINEHRLNLAVEQHFQVLIEEMKKFLQLPD